MKWLEPPIIKIYEALGAIADGRIEVSDNAAKVYSSSRNKFYEISYAPATRSIMANDNGSYWKGYLGYPAIAYLLATGVLPYRAEYGELLKDIAWKDINQKFKNDFEKTLTNILEPLPVTKRKGLEDYASALLENIHTLDFSLLGKKTLPPEGY